MMLPNVASAKTWRAMKRVKRNMMNVTKKRQCWRRMKKKTTEMRLFIGSARALTAPEDWEEQSQESTVDWMAATTVVDKHHT